MYASAAICDRIKFTAYQTVRVHVCTRIRVEQHERGGPEGGVHRDAAFCKKEIEGF